MDLNWLDTALKGLVIFVATVVHGIAGFGLARVSIGLTPLFRSAESVSVTLSMIAVISNDCIWYSVRDEFRWRDWAVPVAGLAVGLPLDVYVFNELNESQLRVDIGITLLVAVGFLAGLRGS